MSNLKKCKLQRKIEKRIFKSHETLFSHEGIHPSNTPTNMLYVANGGLSNGVTREEVYERFMEFGSPTDIIMHPHKSYCFVVFDDKTSCIKACSQHFGQLSLLSHTEEKEKLVYLSYVPQVPAKCVRECSSLPPGLLLLRGYLSDDECLKLLECVQDDSTTPSHTMKNRKVRHFGYQFDYSNNAVHIDNHNVEAIPPLCMCILKRLMDEAVIHTLPDQLTVNTYLPGHGIPAHIDNPEAFEDDIVVISLGSQINMEFRHNGGDSVSVEVPRDSVMVMAGESRYEWSHAIVARGVDLVAGEGGEVRLVKRGVRTSLTFRKIKEEWLRRKRDEVKENFSDSDLVDKFSMLLEKEHVQKVYNTIGDHFSNTRHSPWPRVASFIQSLPTGSLLLDVGCGNGKYLKLRKGEITMVGCDNSTNLCSICSQQSLESLACDVTSLPYRSSRFDAVICIAVLHHLASKERRLSALRELSRVLLRGGRALVYVWAMEQKYKEQNSNYLKDPTEPSIESSQTQPPPAPTSSHFKQINSELSMRVHVNRTAFKAQDTLVPWHLAGRFKEDTEAQVLHRYYHLFKKGELLELCGQLEHLQVAEEYHDQGNWAYELVKT